jgi:hypothetical protein
MAKADQEAHRGKGLESARKALPAGHGQSQETYALHDLSADRQDRQTGHFFLSHERAVQGEQQGGQGMSPKHHTDSKTRPDAGFRGRGEPLVDVTYPSLVLRPRVRTTGGGGIKQTSFTTGSDTVGELQSMVFQQVS